VLLTRLVVWGPSGLLQWPVSESRSWSVASLFLLGGCRPGRLLLPKDGGSGESRSPFSPRVGTVRCTIRPTPWGVASLLAGTAAGT
jgi:hypothetical protein